METKLTLSLDSEIIKRAKEYAKERKTSLSNLVENYFYYLSSDTKEQNFNGEEKTPITNKLYGSLQMDNFDAEKFKEEYLMEKYLSV